MSQTRITDMVELTWERGQGRCWQIHSRRTLLAGRVQD